MGGCKGRHDMEEWRRDLAELQQEVASRLDVVTWKLMSRHGHQSGMSRQGV